QRQQRRPEVVDCAIVLAELLVDGLYVRVVLGHGRSPFVRAPIVRLRTTHGQHGRWIGPLLVAVAVAGCGSSHPAAAKRDRPARPAFRAVLHAPTHTPKAGRPWLYRVRVTDLQGRPIRARITMQVLFGGIPVGKVDGGKTFSFVGRWREPRKEPLIWPARSRGRPLTFEAIV